MVKIEGKMLNSKKCGGCKTAFLVLVIFLLNLLAISKLLAADYRDDQMPTVIITGVVFNDKDRDGERDDGEEGLAKVPISNGLSCILTDSKGNYRFETKLDEFNFVFVITPSGYKNSTNFYQRISSKQKEFVANFGLSLFPEGKNPNFSFVQISDTHVNARHSYTSAGSETFIEDLNEIFPLKPAFIIPTGDLIEDGTRESYECYKEAITRSPIPIYSVIGNHDLPYPDALDKHVYYRDFLGPLYYSFNYGGRHFVILDCMVSDFTTQLDWLKNDMALQPENIEVLFFQHYPATEGLLNLLSQYNTKAIITGHWHASKVLKWKDVLCVNSPTLRFGGIDLSPRLFRLISFKDGELVLEDHFSGCKKHLAIVSPADGVFIQAGEIKIEVNIYDVSAKASKVEYQIDKGAWKEIHQVSKWTWKKEEEENLPGEHILKVRASLNSGEVLQQQVTFKITNDKFPTPKVGSDWTMFQHDSARTGNSPDSVSPPLYLAWSTSIGGTISISSPVIAYETLYIGVQDEEMGGKAGVYALDAKTGKIKWIYKTEASIKHTVVVFNNLVYAMSVDGKVYALDAKTGKERWNWNYSLDNVMHVWDHFSPVVADNVIYLNASREYIIDGSYFVAVALDANTGEKLWEQPELLGGMSCYSSPTIGEGKVYFGNGLFALNRSDGNKIWSKTEGFAGHASPTFFKSVLYFLGSETLHALKADTGEELWSLHYSDGLPMSSPAISGSRIYFGSTNYANGKVFAVDISKGKIVWEYKTVGDILFFGAYARGNSSIVSSPAISGNVLYIGSPNGKLYALDTETGKELWNYNLGVPITSSLAISGNTVYIAGYDGSIYAFTTFTEKKGKK